MAQSSTCSGWDVFTGVFSTVYNGVATATGTSALFGAPSSACGPQNVYVREHVNDERTGYGIVITIATVTVAVITVWALLRIYNSSKA